jgi:hypothetical protein
MEYIGIHIKNNICKYNYSKFPYSSLGTTHPEKHVEIVPHE